MVSNSMAANVENLILLLGDINGTGKTLANRVEGSDGNNLIDGGAGADVMVGNAGADTDVVDDAGDKVTEFAGEGEDTVQSSITYSLASNVENLTLTGNGNINGTGNALVN